MDMPGSREVKALSQYIRIADAKLFCLPKCSPDRDLIERIFVKLDHLLREAAARSIEILRRDYLNPGCIHPRRMRELFPEFRLCVNHLQSCISVLRACAHATGS